MSRWARMNPEKVGSDPREHVPGYGAPAHEPFERDDAQEAPRMSCKLREVIEAEIRRRENRVSQSAGLVGDVAVARLLRDVLAAGDGDVAPLQDAGVAWDDSEPWDDDDE